MYKYKCYCGQITATFSHSHQGKFAYLQIHHCSCIKCINRWTIRHSYLPFCLFYTDLYSGEFESQTWLLIKEKKPYSWLPFVRFNRLPSLACYGNMFSCFWVIHDTHCLVVELFSKHILDAFSAHYRFKADSRGNTTMAFKSILIFSVAMHSFQCLE